jgi:hypothetical protein
VGFLLWGLVGLFVLAALMDVHDRVRGRRLRRVDEMVESRHQERAEAWATQHSGFAFPMGQVGKDRGVPTNKLKQPTG